MSLSGRRRANWNSVVCVIQATGGRLEALLYESVFKMHDGARVCVAAWNLFGLCL